MKGTGDIMQDGDKDVKRSSPLALLNKRSSVELGYYEDEYIQYFVENIRHNQVLNILYYLRVITIRKVLKHFIESYSDELVQFVNIGCGLDTISYWILKNYKNVIIYELDFKTQLEIKTEIISNTPKLKELFPDFKIVDGLVTSKYYTLVDIDLRDADKFKEFLNEKLSPDMKTLFLSEFSLVYIENKYSNEIIKLCAQFSKQPTCYLYSEPFRSYDCFGKNLVNILKNCGLELHAPVEYGNDELQMKRYIELGWDKCVFRDYVFLYDSFLDDEEKMRIRKLEPLDEIEELTLMFGHYVLGVATNKPEAFNEINNLFTRKEINEKIKSYTTDEVIEMINTGTLYKMQPLSLKMTSFSKFFSDTIVNYTNNNL